MNDTEPHDIRTLLRQLPSLAGPLWSFDPDRAPAAPQPLFADWLRFAAEVGIREPHAMTLSSIDADGHPDARMLILKDLDEDWHFASDALSPKGRQITGAPHVALTFYWARLGRQVRVRGAARAMPAAASTADFRGRRVRPAPWRCSGGKANPWRRRPNWPRRWRSAPPGWRATPT